MVARTALAVNAGRCQIAFSLSSAALNTLLCPRPPRRVNTISTARQHLEAFRMEIKFERDQLYLEVWSQPLTRLATKYGISDNGLRKVCKALSIPLPVAGHWAKIAAGKTIQATPLPPSGERTTFISHVPVEPRRSAHPDDVQWKAERVAFEELPDNRCNVDMKPSVWHAPVAPLRKELIEAVAATEKLRRDWERKQNRRASHEPNWGGWQWRTFVDAGQILNHTHKRAAMRVSPVTYERALAVLNALCFEGVQRGFAVRFDKSEGRIVFQGHGGSVELRATEKLTEQWRDRENSWTRTIEKEKFRTPSGILRIHIGTSLYNENVISDQEDLPVEQRLNEIFIRIYEYVIRARETARERKRYEEARAEAEKRRIAAETQRREEAERREAERKKCERLMAECHAWQTAKLIRDYVSHVTSGL